MNDRRKSLFLPALDNEVTNWYIWLLWVKFHQHWSFQLFQICKYKKKIGRNWLIAWNKALSNSYFTSQSWKINKNPGYHSMHRSEHWLDQWQKGKLGTRLGNQSFAHAFAFWFHAPLALLNLPKIIHDESRHRKILSTNLWWHKLKDNNNCKYCLVSQGLPSSWSSWHVTNFRSSLITNLF